MGLKDIDVREQRAGQGIYTVVQWGVVGIEDANDGIGQF